MTKKQSHSIVQSISEEKACIKGKLSMLGDKTTHVAVVVQAISDGRVIVE